MTWRYNLRALLLALLAVAVVSSMVLFLYKSMQADKAWRDFVIGTQAETKAAVAAVEEAQETIEVAQNAGVSVAVIEPLIAQVALSQTLTDELSLVADSVEESEQLGSKAGASLTKSGRADLAELDMFSSLQASGTSVVTPPRPYALIAEFTSVSDSLADALQEMQQLEKAVKDAIEGHLGSLQESLALSGEALIYEVARGKVLEQYAMVRQASDADLAPLRTALDNAQRLLVDQRGIDRDDANQVSKSLSEVNEATVAITSAAAALVSLLGVDAQQMLDELTPEQLWQDQAPWVPIPAPIPDTTPGVPVAPEAPTTPQIPAVPEPPVVIDPPAPPVGPEDPGDGGETEPGGDETDPGEGGEG